MGGFTLHYLETEARRKREEERRKKGKERN
jgi:hypothetical protein